MDKQQLRKIIKQRLSVLSEEQREQSDAAISAAVLASSWWQQARTVFCYVSAGEEINTYPLLKAALSQHKQLAAPLITGSGQMEARLLRSLAELRPDRYGIPAPPPDSLLLPATEIELIIVPGLAFERHSLLRLGRGGGYYDRFLASCPARRLALAREAQLLTGDFPAAAHDLPMDVLISERTVYLKTANAR